MNRTVLILFFLLGVGYCSPSEYILAYNGWDDGASDQYFNAGGVVVNTATYLALDLLNNKTCNNFANILPNTKLSLYSKVDYGIPAIGVANTIDFILQNYTFALGYPLSAVSSQCGIVGGVYEFAILSSLSYTTRLSDQIAYPYFSRVGASTLGQTIAIKNSILYYNSIYGGGWTNVGILSSINEVTTDFAENFNSIASPEISIVAYQQMLIGSEDISIQLGELQRSGARVFLGAIFVGWEIIAELLAEFNILGDNYVWYLSPTAILSDTLGTSESLRGTLGVEDFFPDHSPFTDCFFDAWGNADPVKYPLAGNGGIPPSLTFTVFDSVVVAAMAIDTIDKMGYLDANERVPAEAWNTAIRNITLEGLSGLIKFRPNGDRIGKQEIVFYSPENGWRPSAVCTEDNGCDIHTDVIWHDNTTTVPDLDIRKPFYYWSCHDKKRKYDETGKTISLETPDKSDINNIDSDYHCDYFIDCKNMSDESIDCPSNYTIMFIVFGIITGILILLTILLIIFVCIFGIILKYRRLRAASPEFLLLILISMIIGYISIYSWFGKPHPVSCAFQPWLLGLPVISMIAALSVKNFRIWRIFHYPMKKMKISNFELLLLWSIVMIPAIIIIIIWSIVSTPTAKIEHRDGSDHYICATGGFTGEPGGLVFFFIFVAYSAIVLLIGAIISILARNVPSQFNETKVITISIYNLGFLSVVIIPVFLTVQPFNPFIAWILRTCAILYAFTATMILQFLPILIGIFIIDKGKNVRQFKTQLSLGYKNSSTESDTVITSSSV